MRDKRWVALLLCILIAAFFWIVSAIDDPKGYTKDFVVQLDKPILPTHYRMTDLEKYPETVRVQVHARGGSLLRYTLNHLAPQSYRVRPVVDTSLLQPEGGEYILSESEIKRLILGRPLQDVTRMDINTTSDIELYPREIAFSYEPLSEERADVLFASQIDYGVHRNFKLADTVTIVPSTVRVFGVLSDLEEMVADGGVLVTDTIGIKIDHPGRDTVRVAVMRPSGIDVRPDSVDVILTTNELVYHSFTTSLIQIRNLPQGYDLKILPDRVTVTYLIPRDRVGEKTLFDPGLYVDAREAFSASRRPLVLRAEQLPSQVEMVQLVPDRLDYVLSEIK